jgi:hypothetical protein
VQEIKTGEELSKLEREKRKLEREKQLYETRQREQALLAKVSNPNNLFSWQVPSGDIFVA